MLKFGLIFVGSGVGGLGRYALGGLAQRLGGGTFPVGTLAVNVAGCLVIGFLTAAFSGRVLVSEELRLAVLVGVLGGFTTFSTFGMETFALLNDGQYARAAANVVLSVGLGLAAVGVGYRLAQLWLGA